MASAGEQAYNRDLEAVPSVRSRLQGPLPLVRGLGDEAPWGPEAESILKCRQHIFAVE